MQDTFIHNRLFEPSKQLAHSPPFYPTPDYSFSTATQNQSPATPVDRMQKQPFPAPPAQNLQFTQGPVPLLREDDKLMPYSQCDVARRGGRMMASDMLSQSTNAVNYNYMHPQAQQARVGLSAFNARAHPQSPIPQLRGYPGTSRYECRYGPNYMEALSERFGDDKQVDGRPIYDDPVPHQEDNDNSLSNDDESMMQMTSLQGERVDPNMRIYQVDKILSKNENLTTLQRRSLVSRRNTAKLRLRQKSQREYQMLILVELDAIQNSVSFFRVFFLSHF